MASAMVLAKVSATMSAMVLTTVQAVAFDAAGRVVSVSQTIYTISRQPIECASGSEEGECVARARVEQKCRSDRLQYCSCEGA